MVRAQTRNTVDLKRLVRTLEAAVNEAAVDITEEGIRFQYPDSSIVGFMDLTLQPEFFEIYNGKREIETAVNTEELKKAVTKAKKGDRVTFCVYEGAKHDNLTVEVHSGEETEAEELSHINLDRDKIPEVVYEFSAATVLPVDKLKNIFQLMGDSFSLSIHEQAVIFADGKGLEVGFKEGEGHTETCDVYTDEADKVTSMYPTKYVDVLGKLKRTVDKLKISTGQDFPVKFENDDLRGVDLEYIVAPRIEE